MKVPCDICGELHELSDLEPSLARPDAFLRVPEHERDKRTKANKDFCMVCSEDGKHLRWFVRTLLPVPVEGIAKPCCWGIWCEVSARDYAEIGLLWDDPNQCSHAPLAATLANDIDGYPPTSGLRGTVRFVDVKQIPHFTFLPNVQHVFADEARAGVPRSRVLEWLAPILHADGATRSMPSDSWPFDQGPNVAAITTRRVIDEQLPILKVVHYSDDDSWAFLCGTTGATEDCRVISMASALRIDPTLRGISDLPPGWTASRDHVGAEWKRRFDPEV
jgi:hypothetical protein